MFWTLIDPRVNTFFVEFFQGIPLAYNSYLLWIFVFLGLIISIAVHEYAHAVTAYKLGDSTAYDAGRMGINPFNHFDLLGFGLLLFASIGYGKPVPINPNNFADPKKSLMIVSVAGPISNLILALMVGLCYFGFKPLFLPSVLELIPGIFVVPWKILATFYYALPQIGASNIILAIFNLLPFMPLDGSKIWGYIHVNIQNFLEKYIFPNSFFLILLFILPLTGGLSLAQIICAPFITLYFRIFGVIS